MVTSGIVKYDFGCGPKLQDGFVGVDIVLPNGVDPNRFVQLDLLSLPWPIRSNSVDEVWCSHFLEHVPGRLRGRWMDELYRILIPDGTATITVPTADSPGAIQDFTHEWPPICEQSFLYFNRDARRLMGLDHYPVSCHFAYRTERFHDCIPQLRVHMVKMAKGAV